jgi:type III secretion system YscQ/HrcQ family protein
LSVLESPNPSKSGSSITRIASDAGPLGGLPRLTRRQARLEERLGPGGSRIGPGGLLAGLSDFLGEGLTADRFEVHWRAAGLKRPSVIAQLTWPRLGTRIGLGLEPPLAHALVDRLLGFERLPAEGRLQVTPVEWGILSFVAARALDRLDETPGPLGPWDLAIDRVGPDPFEPEGLGPIVTWRWRVRIGQTAASARLWLPESLLALWLLDDPPAPTDPIPLDRFADISSVWKAEAGSVLLPKGLAKLRRNALLLIEGSPLTGTPGSPSGPIALVQEDPSARPYFEARAVPETGATRLILDSPLKRDPNPRGTPAMPSPADKGASQAPQPGAVAPADSPVTLTVELGRVNIPLHRLADLKPGDVIELGRQAQEPVDLTSGGRLIARGELVQVDTELGVRVTQVFV